MKVAIVGSTGQLGTDLVKAFSSSQKFEIYSLVHKDVEICDHVGTREVLERINPDVVINTAAYHRTDECEDNPEKAFVVNAMAVRNLAQTCDKLNCCFIHISTDYVFDGAKHEPYVEDDLPNPLNVYGVSKLAGEYFVKNICPKHYLIRVASLFGVAGASGKGGNFVETMIRLAKEGKPIRVVDDVVMSPTYTKELAEKIRNIVKDGVPFGVYHITNEGQCSWYEFAKAIFELLGLEPDVTPVSIDEMGHKAKRPKYSVLENKNLKKTSIKSMDHWKDALRAYLVEKRYLKDKVEVKLLSQS